MGSADRRPREQTRTVTCPMPGCGREYTQIRLPAEFLERMRERDLFGEQLLAETCPDGWTPPRCPPCEHKELIRVPQRAVMRGTMQAAPPATAPVYRPLRLVR